MKKICCKTPIGIVDASKHIAKEINKETDKELLEKADVDGFIDPFRYAEAGRRGLLLDGNIPKKGYYGKR